MKFSFVVLIYLLLGVYGNLYSQKINGVSFVASRDSVSTAHIKHVISVNANAVALMPFGFVRNLSEPTIIFDSKRQWFGESEKGIRQYASEFKKAGIKVMLKPQIWIWRGKYTGEIDFKSELEWKKFEDSYEQFILTFANAAKAVNADVFCIGTELEKFVVNRPLFWNSLIKKVRRIFKGKITYAANWDEFSRVPFWSQLDYIGVDAYFPLSEEQHPSIKALEKGWLQHKKNIKRLQEQYQKPILFTEFGYRSVDFSGKEPWDSKRINKAVNHNAQTNGLQAIYNQFWKEDWFAGGFVWKWFLNHSKVGGMDNNRFTPQNKPAENLLRKLYSKQ